jgi:hypothetical protein
MVSTKDLQLAGTLVNVLYCCFKGNFSGKHQGDLGKGGERSASIDTDSGVLLILNLERKRGFRGESLTSSSA